MEIKGFVGTYAPAKGIYSFAFDTEKETFVQTELFYAVNDAKYISYDNNRLAFPILQQDGAGVCVLANGKAVIAGKEKQTACYVVQDEQYVYSVNYHDGTLVRYRFHDEELSVDKTVFIQEEAGCHQAILTSSMILVPCRLLDHMYVYEREPMELKHIISFPKGTGIRHGVLREDERFLYMISEDSCEIFEMDMKQHGAITRKLGLLQHGEHGGGAAIRMSKNARFLYASVREVNRIYVIDVKSWKIIQTIKSGGDHPRDIQLSACGSHVFAANRNSNNLAAFAVDQSSGKLEYKASSDAIPQGVSIVCYEGEHI